ncbi:MAG: glycosyltransferase [bacterium]|nr:glycosyltransferase [bacterium]
MDAIVSVILPTHSREELLLQAIKSVLKQTFQDFELVVINDGSTDGTQVLVDNIAKQDSRVVRIVNEVNLGLVKSLNKAVRHAKGQYIARIDDDDIWEDSEKLSRQVAFLDGHADHILVGGGVMRVDAQGKEIMRFMLPERDQDIRRMMLLNNPFAHAAVMFRKTAWEKSGGYDETLPFSEDWDLWMRFGDFGKYYNFQEYFLRYLKAGQNKTSDDVRVIRTNTRLNMRLRMRYRKKFPNFLKSFILGWTYYFSTFLPFRDAMHPLFSKLRRLALGQPAYSAK